MLRFVFDEPPDYVVHFMFVLEYDGSSFEVGVIATVSHKQFGANKFKSGVVVPRGRERM